MPAASGFPPPLSPVLLAGLALRPLPVWLLQPALDVAFRHVVARHPELFERLRGVAEPIYLVEIVDLPFAVVLEIAPPTARLVRAAEVQATVATATIRGPLGTLLALVQGKLDGDAVFFTRDLTVEGDTEAVVALRNAIDGAAIDLVEETLSVLGPLAGPGRHAVRAAEALYATVARDLETLRRAAVAPVLGQREADAVRLANLERQVADLSRQRRRGVEP